MKDLILPCLGDHDDNYIVTVSQQQGRLIMRCNCPAGQKGTLCKHRLDLLNGDFRRIRLAPEESQKALQDLMETPETKAQMKNFRDSLKALEEEQDVVKKKISALKKSFGRELEGC